MSCGECPVSFITPRSRWIVRLLIDNKMHLDAAGACLFGPDTMAWPQWWADAVALIHSQSIAVKNAEIEAMH